MKRKISGWARNHYGQKKRDKAQLLHRLYELELIQDGRSFSEEEYKDWSSCKDKLDNIFKEEEQYWSKQK